MPQEIELRLSAREEDVADLASSAAIARLATGRPSVARLKTRYFDTPDLAIAKSGLSLRVRKHGRDFIQTVKSANNGGIASERHEWETRLATPTPDLDAVADDAIRHRLLALAGDAPVEPKIETDITRTTRLLRTEAGDEIELAIDHGEIRTLVNSHDVLPVAEVELELKHGSAAALYDVARALSGSAALTVAGESKAERGLRVLEGRGPEARKAGRVSLPDDASAEEAFRLTMAHCLRHITSNIAAVEARNADGVHQIRVGLRRLRAALTGFGPAFRVAAIEDLRGRAKELADAFARKRELDVFAAELLPPIEEADAHPDLRGLRGELDALREEASTRATELVRAEKFTLFMLDAASCAEKRVWREQGALEDAGAFERPARALACESLSAALRKCSKRARHLAKLDVRERHRLRIALKKLRYASEFFAPLFSGKDVSAYLKQLNAAQDIFGALNDAATAEHVLNAVLAHAGPQRATPLRESAAFVAGWHLSRVEPMWENARKRWKKLAKTEPFWTA